MKKCSHCNIYAQGFFSQCPLCNRELKQSENSIRERDVSLYPKYAIKTAAASGFRARIMCLALASVFVSLVCLIINLLTWNSVAWFVWAAALIGYGWLVSRHTTMRDKSAGEKILAQITYCTFLLIALDFSNGKPGLILNFLLPFFCIACIGMINVVTHKNKAVWKQYFEYQLKVVIISLIPMILYFLGVIKVLWPSLASAFFAAVTIFAMLLFYYKQYANEIKKLFHL